MTQHRLTVNQQLHGAIERAARRQDLFTTLLLRLGGLDTVREQLGYDKADEVVQIALDRLRKALDAGDWVSPLSDNEFVIISFDCNSPSCAIKGSSLSLDVLRRPIAIDGFECPLEPHAGIALYPVDGQNPQDLLKHALAAERHAEERDTEPRYAFFNHELGQRASEDFNLQQELRRAISRGLFSLYLQPKVDLEARKLIGAEALIRWPQPDGSVRLPGQFLGVAERGRLMRPLGAWVAGEACRLMGDWQARGFETVPLSINVSAEQFRTPDWLDAWERQIDTARVDPAEFVVEITESVAMVDDESTRERLDRLHRLGVRISVDDFGVGFSNLAMLARFPIDEVKIDRSLIQGVDQGGPATAICRAVSQIGQDLGVSVLAEGIETESQAQVACELGCERGQGFLYGRPMPAEEFEQRWLRPHK